MKQKMLLFVALCTTCLLHGMEALEGQYLALSAQSLSFFDEQLIKSAQEDSTMLAKVWLMLGADANASDRFNATAFHYATYNSNLELLSLLKARGAHVNAATLGGCTALHITALLHTKSKVASWLLEHGALIDSQDEEGCTALHRAVGFHRPRIAQLLVEHGSNVSIKDNRGQLPEEIDAVCLFDICYAPFKRALLAGNMAKVEKFLKQGVSLRFKTQYGTPLHWAVICPEVTRLLPRFFEHVALSHEQSSQDTALCECLNVQDLGGATPLHWAGQEGNVESWQQLVRYGAQMTLLDDYNITPLYALNEALLGWEVDEKRRGRFFEFLAQPIGSPKEHTTQSYIENKERVFAILCVLKRLQNEYGIQVPHDVVHLILNMLMPYQIKEMPLGTYHKKQALPTVIESVSFRQLSVLLKHNVLARNAVLHALKKRHTDRLKNVCALETNQGNSLLAAKLVRCLSTDTFLKLMDVKYQKVLGI